MYSALVTAIGKTAQVEPSNWWAAVNGLAGVLGVLGFALAVLNWHRLRPDIFVTMPAINYQMTQDRQWRTTSMRLIVHNAGAAGVTITALRIDPSGTKGAFTHPNDSLDKAYLDGPDLPCRLEGADTQMWTVDVPELRRLVPQSGDDWLVSAVWYGRARPWGWQEAPPPKEGERKRRLPVRVPESKRRRNVYRMTISTANQVPTKANGDRPTTAASSEGQPATQAPPSSE